MLKTTKYEFGKPEQNDFYDINVHNNNMDEIERALTEFDDSGKAEGITSFTDMFTKLATGNKLAVTLRNLKAGLQFCLHVGSIVNNCVTDNARLPLSAAQGKVLMDAVTKLNSDLLGLESYKTFGITKEVTPSTEMTIGSFTLPAGTWILIGYLDWDRTRDYSYNFQLNGRTVRSNASNGGGVINASVAKLDTQTTLPVRAYIGGSVSATARVSINTIKIG